MYSALTVAGYIIKRCSDTHKPASNLKLQKLLYFVQAEFLVGTAGGDGMIDYKAILNTLSKGEIIESLLSIKNPSAVIWVAHKAQDKHYAEMEKMLDEMDKLSNSHKAMDHIKWMELNEKYKKLEEKWDNRN